MIHAAVRRSTQLWLANSTSLKSKMHHFMAFLVFVEKHRHTSLALLSTGFTYLFCGTRLQHTISQDQIYQIWEWLTLYLSKTKADRIIIAQRFNKNLIRLNNNPLTVFCHFTHVSQIKPSFTDSNKKAVMTLWDTHELPNVLNWGESWTDQVMSERLLVLHVFEAVLADPQLGLLPIILRKRWEVPGIDLKVSYLDLIHILHFGDLKVRETVSLLTKYWKWRKIVEEKWLWLHTASCSFSSAAVVGSISAYVCKEKLH